MKRLMTAATVLGLLAACSTSPAATTTGPAATEPTTPATATTVTTAAPSQAAAATTTVAGDASDLTRLWSYGLTSVRTGELLVGEGGEHAIDPADISYGYNLVVDAAGNVLDPRATPLAGGEQILLTSAYQDDHNVREYARVVSLMAPIRDTILYHYESTSREEWLDLTTVLAVNGIKTEDAATVDGRSVLSTTQVYDYIATGSAEGSPVARYLEEAGLELKCLAFIDFDFTNPEGGNHCEEHGLAVGSGIELP